MLLECIVILLFFINVLGIGCASWSVSCQSDEFVNLPLGSPVPLRHSYSNGWTSWLFTVVWIDSETTGSRLERLGRPGTLFWRRSWVTPRREDLGWEVGCHCAHVTSRRVIDGCCQDLTFWLASIRRSDLCECVFGVVLCYASCNFPAFICGLMIHISVVISTSQKEISFAGDHLYRSFIFFL